MVWYASRSRNPNLNHWKNELGAVLYKIVTRKVKNSSQQSMYKLIKQTLIDEEELNNATTIKWLITSKFDKEQLYNLDIVSNAFVSELPKIMMLLSTSEPKMLNHISNHYETTILSYIIKWLSCKNFITIELKFLTKTF